MHRTTRSFAILVAGLALTAGPTLAAEPPADFAHDGVVTVVFHDPEYDNGNGIEGADVELLVVDLAHMIIEDYYGTTDASGVASFTEVFRAIDPSLEIHLEATAIRYRTFVAPDGCTVGEQLVGTAIAPTGLEVTIDVEIENQLDERTCPPPSVEPAVIVEGNAVDPGGEPMTIVHAEAVLETVHGLDAAPISTSANGSFRVEVPAAASPDTERALEVTLIGPDVRTVEDEEGCLITWTLVARGSWTLIGDQAPEPMTLVAAEEALSGVCGGATATPLAPVAPNITLPPTDTVGGNSTTLAGGLAAALFLLLAISLAATIAAERRVSRRGS